MDDLMKIRPARSYDVPGHPGLKSSYQWKPGMKGIIPRVSKSSLGQKGFCSQQYFIKYVLGVKEPENDNMIRGTNVHNAVEEFYRSVSVSYAASMRSYGYDTLLQYFIEFIPDESYTLGEEKHLKRFFIAEARRFMTCETDFFLPIANEVSIDAVVDIDGQLVHLTGIVDRMFADEEGRCHIHDVKTGEFSQKSSAKKWKSMREEMAYYAYLIKKCDHEVLGGLDCVYWGWDHTGGDGLFRGREGGRTQEIGSMLANLRQLLSMHGRYKGGTDGRYFPLIDVGATKYICEPWCRVKGFCPRYERILMRHEDRGEEE